MLHFATNLSVRSEATAKKNAFNLFNLYKYLHVILLPGKKLVNHAHSSFERKNTFNDSNRNTICLVDLSLVEIKYYKML